MSMANPFIPADLDNPELARDMRVMANRLDAQADRFEAAGKTISLDALGHATSNFRNLARSLRINADRVQPHPHALAVDEQHTIVMDPQDQRYLTCSKCGVIAAPSHPKPDPRCGVPIKDARDGAMIGHATISIVQREPAPALVAAQVQLDEHLRQRQAWRLTVEDFEVRNTPRGMRCAIAEDRPGDVSFNRPKVRYLRPDEQPPLGERWTVYPVNDGCGPWVLMLHATPSGDVVCPDCHGSGCERAQEPCMTCAGRRVVTPEQAAAFKLQQRDIMATTGHVPAPTFVSLDDELRRKLAADAIQSTLTVKRCSAHHLQLRDEDDAVVLDWWPTTGKARAPTQNGISSSTHRSVDTLLVWLRSL